MYNSREGSRIEVCAMLSNPIAEAAAVQLTVMKSTSRYDDAEG